jgi:hypothetical protein
MFKSYYFLTWTALRTLCVVLYAFLKRKSPRRKLSLRFVCLFCSKANLRQKSRNVVINFIFFTKETRFHRKRARLVAEQNKQVVSPPTTSKFSSPRGTFFCSKRQRGAYQILGTRHPFPFRALGACKQHFFIGRSVIAAAHG